MTHSDYIDATSPHSLEYLRLIRTRSPRYRFVLAALEWLNNDLLIDNQDFDSMSFPDKLRYRLIRHSLDMLDQLLSIQQNPSLVHHPSVKES